MNTHEQAKQLIEKYCELYGIQPKDLRRKSSHPFKVIVKNDKYINTASMRMALGYFLFLYFPLRIKEIALMVGYTDHSPLSSQRRQIASYIQNNDSYFMPYYGTLFNLATSLGIETEYKRACTQTIPFMRHETDASFLENIKYYENA
jgi:AraC-like DNA-binding protein